MVTGWKVLHNEDGGGGIQEVEVVQVRVHWMEVYGRGDMAGKGGGWLPWILYLLN